MNSKELRQTLRAHGLSDEVIDLAWPTWWTAEAEHSVSASTELRFVLARRLGLDAQALIDVGEPRFVWRHAKFKRLTAADSARDALVSFGTSVARVLVRAVEPGPSPTLSPSLVRSQLLHNAPHVSLEDVLSYCWGIGIPVIGLHVFPLTAKRMSAMSIRIGEQYAVLVARETRYPAQMAYLVAHELGHIALGHLAEGDAVVDIGDPLEERDNDDPEEVAADRFALELLTGDPDVNVTTDATSYSGAALALSAIQSSPELQIEPGTIALCFGHATGAWDRVAAALKRIYPDAEPIHPSLNAIALNQISQDAISPDSWDYLLGVMGIEDA
jgi:hypothetical protein